MSTVVDWTLSAARDIQFYCGLYRGAPENLSVYHLAAAIIKEHCPWKPDVAYMPVPRCDTCRHWERHASNGVCSRHSDKTREALCTEGDFGCVQWDVR